MFKFKQVVCTMLTAVLAAISIPGMEISAASIPTPSVPTESAPISAIEFTSPVTINFMIAERNGSFTVSEPITHMVVETTIPDPTITDFDGTSMGVDYASMTDPAGVTTQIPMTHASGYEDNGNGASMRTHAFYFEDINIPTGSTVTMGISRFATGVRTPIEFSIILNGTKIYQWSGLPALLPGDTSQTVSEWSILAERTDLGPGQYVDTVDHWASDRIEWLVLERDVNCGASEATKHFGPDEPITRVNFVEALAKATRETVNTTESIRQSIPFRDVNRLDGSVFYINWAGVNDIVMGTTDSEGYALFHPNEPITREDLASILGRYFTLRKITLPTVVSNLPTFKDVTSINSYAKDPVSMLQKADIIHGYADGTFQPQGTVSRAEAASILYELCNQGIIG